MKPTSTPKNRIGFPTFFPGLRQFDDNPKSRRLQFMKTRFNKRKCKCGKVAHYKLSGKRISWCRACLPDFLRRRLDMDYQMNNVILPMVRAIDRS